MDESPVDVKIVIRDFDQQRDEACIYSTWRNSAYYTASKLPDGDPKAFFSRVSKIIKTILETAKVRIACLLDSPQTIIGYSVSTGDHLNWIYVKESYRNIGVATMLWPKEIKTVTCYMTKMGAKIADKKKIEIKENENERYH